MINFQEQNDFSPRDFYKILLTDSCTATEGRQMKKLKFHRL